jgi:hypothetical protein
MLLADIDDSLGLTSRATIRAILLLAPHAPVDILKVFLYKPQQIGKPFSDLAHELLRGTSDWTRAERELLGAYVSSLNRCFY